jgi:hypothetical protein
MQPEGLMRGINAPVSGLPQGGVSGIPRGFDSHLLPLGQEIDNNMRPEGGEFENLNLAFFIMRPGNKFKKCGQRQFWRETASGHSRKHPYHPHGGNRKLTPLPPSDVLIHLLLSETIFSPLPLRTAEISAVGGVWIFSVTTHHIFYFFMTFLEIFSTFFFHFLVIEICFKQVS